MSASAQRSALALLLGLAAAFAGACGVSNPTSGIDSRVGQARDAQAIASLQQALITANVARTDDTGSEGGALAAGPAQRDSTNSYTGAVPIEPGRIQVIGGSRDPLLLVSYSEQLGGAPGYVAAWQGGSTTRWYAGTQPPAYVATVPTGPGWTAAAPVGTIPASVPAQ